MYANLSNSFLNKKGILSLQEEAKPEMKEQLDEVGFIYYLILARLEDLNPRKPEGKLCQDIKLFCSIALIKTKTCIA